jgi:hypothetical protein
MPDKNQIDRVKELTRELGCDEDEAAFDAAVKKLSGRSRSRSMSQRNRLEEA